MRVGEFYMRTDDLVVLIAGASTGIGRALAIGFSQERATVVALARSKEKLEELAATIRAEMGTVLPLACDVSDEAQVTAAVERTIREFGRLDALVVTASQIVSRPVIECTVADWDRLFAVNCRGTFLLCRAVLPVMRSQGRGRIVIYSSGAARGRKVREAIYSATKAAQIAFARVLSREEADHGILVNVIVPGRTRTPMIPDGEQEPEVHLETTIYLTTLPDDGPTGRVWKLMEEVTDI